MLSRMIALLTGTLALASLRGQFDALPDPMAFWPLEQKLWFLAGFFTILTNLGVAGLMFGVARGWRMPGLVAAAMVVSIVMVGVVYHLLLARLWNPVGAAWWADQGLHSVVPVAVCIWWWGFADKRVGWRDLPLWLIWPAVYCGYALVRGYLTGFWPYPFLDGDALGMARLGVNFLGLLAGFAALGAGVVGVARLGR